MNKIINKEPYEVFKYFEEISCIPHGSGNREKIRKYCLDFAKEHNLKAISDDADNVIIYKDGTKGYEDKEPIILQGHTDMVCQKTGDSLIDFEKDGLDIFVEGDFVKAKGTTLGGDNGIAVAMIMAILADDTLSHPPIEAVFTSDEEIGMIGAAALDVKNLKGKRMINLDSEEEDTLTVSCAGGGDIKAYFPVVRKKAEGTKVIIGINGLKGGHSGVEIDKNRVNANILAGRILNELKNISDYEIISINGGNKSNAIPCECVIELVLKDTSAMETAKKDCFAPIIREIKDREEKCNIEVEMAEESEFFVISDKEKLLYILLTTPNGIIDMSQKIEGLVETSLNLGSLLTGDDEIIFHHSLRSNKKSALRFLKYKMSEFYAFHGCETKTFGEYAPWEYRENSYLRDLYVREYEKKFGKTLKVSAIHAGLECAVFSSTIEGLDCISVGPDMFDVHTVDEKLSISSVKSIYELVCEILKKCQ